MTEFKPRPVIAVVVLREHLTEAMALAQRVLPAMTAGGISDAYWGVSCLPFETFRLTRKREAKIFVINPKTGKRKEIEVTEDSYLVVHPGRFKIEVFDEDDFNLAYGPTWK